MKEVTAFASGVNEAREVAGFALAGVPIGASASNLREDAIQAILRSAGPVFLDSGAFSEGQFSPQTQRMEIVNRIDPREWRRRLAIYVRVAQALGNRLSVVAPDCVGDQDETLDALGTATSFMPPAPRSLEPPKISGASCEASARATWRGRARRRPRARC